MRILNARLGFANNSSSSHSMIIMSPADAANLAEDASSGGYGWDDFTLTTAESKLDYLATSVWQQLTQQGDETSALVVAREIMGMPKWLPHGTIDHQSIFELPAGEDGATVHAGFARAFAAWIQTDGVVVLGGNDNSDGHPLANKKDALPFDRESSNSFVAKFDVLSDSWTLFNKNNGAKLRMKFEPGEAPELEKMTKKPSKELAGNINLEQHILISGEPPKSGSPELVDVKITDFCDIGCAYCYQGSTPEGAHAKLDDIRTIARQLFKAGVLEVAIGGGEPTRHPEFPEILEIFASHGIVANFTTRDLSFLDDHERARRIMSASKSVAVSVNSAAQIQKAQNDWKAHPLHEDALCGAFSGSRFTFQYVIGTSSDSELERIFERAADGAKLTLLGYKDSGRGLAWREGAGKTFALRDAKVQAQTGAWVGMLQNAFKKRYASVCIDTALARESEALLLDKKVPRHLWHKSEALVSMYVDAVAMTMGKSSYETASEVEPFEADWLVRYAGWEPSVDGKARKGKMHGPG